MQGTYIFSDFTPYIKGIIEELGIPNNQIISAQSFDKEACYHDWITDLFKNNPIKKILIPLNLNTIDSINDGLKIALHIRLNYELSLSQRFIPIIILSDLTIEVILRSNNFDSDNNPQNLMFTKGFDLSGFDSDQIKNLISKEENYGEDDYQTGILDKLKIKQKASVGKHSIANAWGCFKLAQVTGLRDEIYKHESVSEQLKTLYAKYLICYNDTYTKDKLIDLNSINCNGKRVLFIDDQADDGWSILMKNIFKSSGNGFMAIDSSKYKNSETKLFHDYDGFYSECQQQIGKEWDLIIIDLRLNPEKEDIDNEMISPSDFSGYKLIDEFLNENEGYQIIVSTASNKIWNINAALKRGASSYYIKESPEFNYSISSTKTNFDNFKNEVQKCFDRKYLRDIYKSFYLAKSSAGNTNSDFMSESNTMLDIAWSIIRHEKLDFSFLTLFQIVESFTNSKYDYHDNGVIIVGKKQFMIEEKTGKFEWKLTFNRDNKKGDYFSSGIELKENKMSVNNLFKTSCVLSFVFKKDDNYLKRLGELNEIRHKIAHKGAKKFAAYNDIKDVLEIIKLIRDVI